MLINIKWLYPPGRIKMYELIDIAEDGVTRLLKLRNIDTGIIEECFDDSTVVSDINFGFMQIGQQYECKIKLFGKPLDERVHNSNICKIINKKIMIGQKAMVEVQINDSRYYIPRQKVIEYLDGDSFIFCYTRKDLIQVNNTIHADLL